VRAAAALIALLGWTRVAAADVPWAAGVAQTDQTKANELFAEANELFAQQAHAPALAKYQAALALWDHPLIAFNMAVTLVRLDRLLEAADAIDRALRFGASPFPTREQYQQALDYQKLVSGRVGTIEVACGQQDVFVLLDGKPWFTCPGKQASRVLAGEHVIVGERAGFMTSSRRIVVAGAATRRAELALVPLSDAVALEYRWPRWLPWTAAGSGAAIALGGAALWFAGQRHMDRFEADFKELCPKGCSADLDGNPTERQLARERDGARLEGTIGVTLLAAGGAIAIGGVVWAVVNRPHHVTPTLELGPTGGGGAARLGWQF
jgi:hypothetical protein